MSTPLFTGAIHLPITRNSWFHVSTPLFTGTLIASCFLPQVSAGNSQGETPHSAVLHLYASETTLPREYSAIHRGGFPSAVLDVNPSNVLADTRQLLDLLGAW